jgi:hypothetical protein
MRKIFEPEREEVTGGWRKFRNEEVHNFHSSPKKIWFSNQELAEQGM